MPGLRCPACGSAKVNQLRQPTGPMWCENCSFRIEEKWMRSNPFYIRSNGGKMPKDISVLDAKAVKRDTELELMEVMRKKIAEVYESTGLLVTSIQIHISKNEKSQKPYYTVSDVQLEMPI